MAYVGRGVDKISNIEVLDAITFTDSAGPYNITQSSTAFVPTSPNALVISIDGVIQSPSSYTLSVATITFDSSMASTSTMDFMYQIGTGVMTAPSDGSVTAAKLATDAVETVKIKDLNVTNAKIAAGTIDVTAKITGVVPSANLGSGTASSSTILYGDSTYKAEPVGGSAWQSVVTGATLSAVAGNGYPINTTSNACTVTLPAGSVGDTIELVDYAGTWDTNNVTLTTTEKIKGSDDDVILNQERQGIKIVYVDATQGWEAITGVNESAPALKPPSYDIEFLVVGGGGGGGEGGYAAGGGAGGYIESTQSVQSGFAITIAVGDGGDKGGSTGAPPAYGTDGGDSSISGSGITDKTADGGGVGANTASGVTVGNDGGSGGGGRGNPGTGGSATAGQGYDGGDGYEGGANYGCGGGGGSSAVGGDGTSSTGGDGGDGTANDITGSSVTYAGGGGGGTYAGGTAGSGGTGGGGAAGAGGGSNVGADGTDGLGGGGGGASAASGVSYVLSGDGGSGIVILRMLTANYTGTVSGNETPITDGDYTVLKFINTAGGSYTT